MTCIALQSPVVSRVCAFLKSPRGRGGVCAARGAAAVQPPPRRGEASTPRGTRSLPQVPVLSPSPPRPVLARTLPPPQRTPGVRTRRGSLHGVASFLFVASSYLSVGGVPRRRRSNDRDRGPRGRRAHTRGARGGGLRQVRARRQGRGELLRRCLLLQLLQALQVLQAAAAAAAARREAGQHGAVRATARRMVEGTQSGDGVPHRSRALRGAGGQVPALPQGKRDASRDFAPLCAARCCVASPAVSLAACARRGGVCGSAVAVAAPRNPSRRRVSGPPAAQWVHPVPLVRALALLASLPMPPAATPSD